MNEMMSLVREEQLLRKVDMVKVVKKSMKKVRGMFNDNMGRHWNRVRNRGNRGGMAGGAGVFGGADGGADRVGFGNRGGFGGGRGAVGGGRGGFGGGRGPCFVCGIHGHIARDCLLSWNNQQQQPAPAFQHGRAAMPGWQGQVPLLPAPGPEPIVPPQLRQAADGAKGGGK